MTPHRKFMSLSDGVLFVLGLAGFTLLFTLLPSQHPDAAADYSLGPEGAADAAGEFLRTNGYETANLDPSAEFLRDAALLDSLQKTLTRPGAVALLKSDSAQTLPAYYWEVTWVRGGAGPDDSDDDALFTVTLDAQGRVWEFRKQTSVRPVVNRRVLASLGAPPADGGLPNVPDAVTDSLLRTSLVFSRRDPLWRLAADPEEKAVRADSVWQALTAQGEPEEPVAVGSEWAVAIARYHLQHSGLQGHDLKLDSVWTADREGRSTARVRFTGREEILGQAFEVTADVHVTGALVGLESHFDPEPRVQATFQNEEEDGMQADVQGDMTLDDILDILSVLVYLLLFIGFLFVFLRRLHARAIDAKAALRDALWGGFFLAAAVTLSAGYGIVTSVPNLWFGVFLAGIAMAASGAAGALIIFIVSNAADSIARGVWPEKLESLTLVRLGLLRNVPVGLSFLRGVWLGGALLGVIIGTLALFPKIAVDVGDEAFLYGDTLAPVGFLFGSSAFMSLFMMLMLLLGIGTLVYQRWPRSYVVIPVLVLMLVLGRVSPAGVAPAWGSLVLSTGVGTALALAFWRYDALTCFMGYLVVSLYWGLAPAWIIEPNPLPVDTLTVLVLTGVAVAVGLVGAFSGRTEAELPSYVPTYVQDMAREERLRGELEIAHVVQESFLPKRMPELEGVDLAAMCLAAQEVGGDYYDFVELGDGRLAIAVGDVSGKGIQAAFYMTLVKGFFTTLSRTQDSPAEILRCINTMFFENAPRGMFITLICGILDVEARTFTFARAGHNPLIVKRAPNYEPEFLQPPGLAIGLARSPRFDASIEEVTLQLRQGDVLVFYTDGFTEAMNARRQQYGDARLARKVHGIGQRSAVEILRAVSEDVHHFLEAVGRQDDMTMVVIKMEPAPPHGAPPSLHQEMASPAEAGLRVEKETSER